MFSTKHPWYDWCKLFWGHWLIVWDKGLYHRKNEWLKLLMNSANKKKSNYRSTILRQTVRYEILFISNLEVTSDFIRTLYQILNLDQRQNSLYGRSLLVFFWLTLVFSQILIRGTIIIVHYLMVLRLFQYEPLYSKPLTMFLRQ